ncbi:hypothetical protein V6N13_047492 [Hibiscus sabdariffa]
MVAAAGNWDWRKFQDLLRAIVLFRIATKMGPMARGGCDLVADAMARLAQIRDFDQVDFAAPLAWFHPLLLRDALHASTPNVLVADFSRA